MEIEFKSKPRVCFEVEKIIGMSSDGSYQVQWAPTWVSKFHLVGCEHLIQEFLLQQQAARDDENHEIELETPCVSYGSDFEKNSEYHEIKPEILNVCDGSDLMLHTTQVTVIEDNFHEPVALLEQSETLPWEHNSNCSTSGNFSALGESVNDISDGSNRLEEFIVESSGMPTSTSNIVLDIDDYEDDEEDEIKEESTIVLEIDDDDEEEEDCSKEGTADQHSLLANIMNCVPPTPNSARNNVQKAETKIVSESQLKSYASAITQSKLRQCPICGRMYHGTSMKRHLRTHSGVKPFVCDICKKRFAQKGTLKTHIRVHTGEKPFQCSSCSKTFTTKRALQNHHACCPNLGVG